MSINMASLYLIWVNNGVVSTGNINSSHTNNILTFNINYPDNVTDVQSLSVYSSAQIEKTLNKLVNVKLFLTGDPLSLQIVQTIWPTLGNGYFPQRPDLNGGFEISFDGGSNFIRFDPSTGFESLPSTWITLPANAIGSTGTDGTLNPFDTATFIVRLTIPPGAVEFQKLTLGLALDFDVI